MRWLRYQLRTFAAFLVLWREHLTNGGKTLTIGMLLCLPELTTLDSPLFMLFWVLLTLLVVSGLFGWWYRPRLVVRILAAETASRHEAVDLVVQILNRSAHAAYDLSIELVDSSGNRKPGNGKYGQPGNWEFIESHHFVAQLDRGQLLKLRMVVRPLRRGVFELPSVRVLGTSPFNVVRFARTYSVSCELIVLPSFRPLASLDASRWESKYAGEQEHTLFSLGHHGEYFSSREYQPGMPVRRWDYSSWARLGKPVVREFTDPSCPTAAIILDTFVADVHPNGDEEIRELEATVSLAAALSDALTANNYRITHLAVGDCLRDLSRRSSWEQHDLILRELATVTAGSEDDCSRLRDQLATLPSFPGAVFVVLNRINNARQKLGHDLESRGSAVTRVLLCADGESSGTKQESGEIVTTFSEVTEGRVEIR